MVMAMKGRFPVLVAGFALLAASPVLAQSAATTQAATALVDLLTPPAAQKAGLDSQLQQMREGAAIRSMLRNSPQYRAEAAKNQPAFNAAIARMGAMQADALGPVMREMQPVSRQLTIEAYAREFTEAELKAITAFYSSPAGMKLRARQPAVLAGVNRQIQQRFGPRMQAAEKAIAPKLDAELRKLFPSATGAPK